MSKFAVSYMEVYKSTFIIEADTYEEAEEKLRKKAEDCTLNIDLADDFEHWDVTPSDTFGTKAIPEDRDVSYFRHLKEE